MKKLLFLSFCLLLIFGCNPDDDEVEQVVYELVPVISTNLPESFRAGEHYIVELTYSPPTSCHRLSSVNYELEGTNTFTFGVVNYYIPADHCQEEVGLTAKTSFDFTAEPVEFYIFKFWQGEDEAGESEFLTVEVPVIVNN